MPKFPKIKKIRLSKNFRERKGQVKFIVFHCSSVNDEDELFDTLEGLGLSTHYIINQQGEITLCVEPSRVAYHAGKSKWRDRIGESLNEESIGIECIVPNLGQNKEDYSYKMFLAINSLLDMLRVQYKIRKENVVGHSDIAPDRKADPGIGFPWYRMYRSDNVLWYRTKQIMKDKSEKEMLEIIGYDTSDMMLARCAFCRHFMPEEFEVVEDIQCLLDNPYPKDFAPKDFDEYMHVLSAVCCAYDKEGRKKYWFME